MLLKKHQDPLGLSEWGKRYFDVDDFLGILLYFKTFRDMVRARRCRRLWPIRIVSSPRR